jgi:hypothetical protein
MIKFEVMDEREVYQEERFQEIMEMIAIIWRRLDILECGVHFRPMTSGSPRLEVANYLENLREELEKLRIKN